jgi:integrase
VPGGRSLGQAALFCLPGALSSTSAGIDAASHVLGHSDLSTTLGIYGHRDDSDLETAIEGYA